MSLIQSSKTERNLLLHFEVYDKVMFTLLNNKREFHLNSILKCRDLGKSTSNPKAHNVSNE